MRSPLLAWMGFSLLAACRAEPAQGPLPGGAQQDSAAQAPSPPADEPSPPAQAPSPLGRSAGKPAAPVDITAQIEPRSAELRITFREGARDVEIKVWGTDGLVVQQAPSAAAPAVVFKAGESTVLRVALDPPARASNLAVSVSGVFGGRRASKVQSFSIGSAAPEAAPGELKTDASGRPVRVLKH